ncbi:MAG: TetR family transcriptional regulator [Pseudomonadota bacterium]|nr:TetR family transcriptional regulator [Pseudomonadota bacterium]
MARRTKQDAQATREALLDAAEQVFEQRGVSRTSLGHIAEAAGLTRGAVYWHFKDKADLFNAMLERVTLPLEADMADVVAALADASADATTLMRRYFAQGLARIDQHAQTRRVLAIATHMVEHTEEMDAVRARHMASHAAKEQALASLLAHAAAQRGAQLPAPVETLARGLFALVYGLVNAWLLRPDFDLAGEGAAAIDAYLRGIGLPPLPIDQG